MGGILKCKLTLYIDKTIFNNYKKAFPKANISKILQNELEFRDRLFKEINGEQKQ